MNTKTAIPSPTPEGKNEVFKIVSRETFLKLETYAATLLKWNQSIRLIADSTESPIWSRHILDAIQTLNHLPKDIESVADMGAGGGLPGLPIAAALPDVKLTLIESDQRKSVFMEVAAREMGLKNVTVIAQRLESLKPQPVDVVMARALAPLKNLIAFSDPLRHKDSMLLFHKGRNHSQEMDEAKAHYQFDFRILPSQVADDSVLIELKNIEPK